jgi:hypothetical protein
MQEREAPFRMASEPKKVERDQGTKPNADVFEFESEQGDAYIYKELRQGARAWELHYGDTPEAKVRIMKRVYETVKQYLGDYAIDTNFVIGKDKDGEPTIIIAQKKVPGVRFDKLPEDDPRYKKAHEQFQDLENRVAQLGRDQLFTRYPYTKLRLETADAANPINIIVDEQGNIKIVDW